MDNDRPESQKTHSRQFEAENPKSKVAEEAIKRARTDPDTEAVGGSAAV